MCTYVKKILFLLFLLLFVGCTGAFQFDKSLNSEDLAQLISLETKPDGTGQSINQNVVLNHNETLNIYAVHRNSEGEFVKSIEVSWRLVGGVGNLTILSNGTSAQFSSAVSGAATVQVIYEDEVIKQAEIEVKDLVFPELTWVSNSVTAAEGTMAVFTVEISKVYDQDVSFDVSTSDGTAVAGGDYTGKASETVTIPSGDTQTTISIPVLADNLYEHLDENFTVTLSNFSKTFMNTSDTATVTVTNQDALPAISVADLSVNEDVGNAQVVLTLSRPSTQNVQVNYATSDDSADSGGSYIDYTTTTGTSAIVAGESTVLVNVPINDDNLDEVNEKFDLTISSPVNATLGGQTTAAVTVNDNDLPSEISVADTTVIEGGTASVTISFSPATGQSVGFLWETQDDGATASSDYTSQSATSVAVPKHTTSMTVNVVTLDDSIACEVDENISVVVSNFDNLTAAKDTGTVGITENDFANIVITDSVVTEGDGTATYTASLSQACSLDVSFEYKTFPLDAIEEHDYTYSSGTATLVSGASGASTNISVPIVDESLNEGPQKFLLVAMNNENLSNAKLDHRSIAVTTINDNDGAQVPSVLDFSDGNGSRCVAMGDGDVKCFGAIQEVYHYGEFNIGDEPSDMGASLQRLNVGSVNGDGIAPFNTVKGISVSDDYACAIQSDDILKCWGYNYYAQLGIGEGQNSWGDELTDLGDNLKSVSLDSNNIPEAIETGNSVTCALMYASATPSTKFLKCWGYQYLSGQGDGSGRIGESDFDVRDLPPIDFGTGLEPKQFSVGKDHTCAVLSDDTLKCFGENNNGQLGINSSANVGDTDATIGNGMPTANLGSTVKSVSSGDQYTCAVFTNNRIKCWGYDSSGRAGRGATSFTYSDTTIGNNTGEMETLDFMNLGTKDDNDDGTPDGVNFLEFSSVTAGSDHTCAITTDGNLKCWGLNDFGQLGYGHTDNVEGSADFGDNLPYVDLGTGLTATDVFVGNRHTCALLNDSTVKCWGRNDKGQLGLGHTNHIGDEAGEMGNSLSAVDLNGNVIKLSESGFRPEYTCAIMDTNDAKCWGDNNRFNMLLTRDRGYGDESGEMGGALPAVNINTGVNARQIEMTSNFSCALDSTGDVYCWGEQDNGALGNGVDTDLIEIGMSSYYLGNFPKVLLPTGKKALQLAVSYKSGCALLDDFTVRCWGENYDGEAGFGSSDGIIGDSPSELGDNMQAVNFGSDVYPISLVSSHPHGDEGGSFCALLNNQQVKCWGNNSDGQAGVESASSGYGDEVSETGDSWPYVMFGTTGFSSGGPKVKKVIGSQEKFCALFENQKIKCWGRGYYGILGTESYDNVGADAGSMGDNLGFVNLGTGVLVKNIYNSSTVHSCVLTTLDKVKCWGHHSGNGAKYLGVSTNAWNIGGVSGDMGDNLGDSDYGSDPLMRIADGCGLHTNGRLRCFGDNGFGQLGQEIEDRYPFTFPNIGDNIPYIKLEPEH